MALPAVAGVDRRVVMTKRWLAAVVLLILGAAACAKPGTQPAAEDSRSQITGVRWSLPPDLRTPLPQIPWCADSYGHSPVYPCKWDRRERPVVDWDPMVPDVVIWLYGGGCDRIAYMVKVSPADDVAFSCFYAPPPIKATPRR